MSLQYQVESLEGLDENLHSFYEQTDDGYRLAVDLGDRFVPAEQVAGLKSNHDKLLAEKKEQQKRANEAAEKARLAAEEKARKENDYESLLKSSEQKRLELEERFNEIQRREEQKTVEAKALELAASLADGDNAKLLAQFIKPRLKLSEGTLKITDNDGNLTVSKDEDLLKEFSGNAMYKSLLRGTNASGGGAGGSKNGGVTSKEITREQFDAMPQHERSAFFKSGGKITN